MLTADAVQLLGSLYYLNVIYGTAALYCKPQTLGGDVPEDRLLQFLCKSPLQRSDRKHRWN